MRRWLLISCLFALLLPAARAQIGPPPVTGMRGAVAAPEPHAADVGLAILQRGGTAVDAAVAMGFALAVTLPSAGNLGGGGFFVIHLSDGRRLAIDGREVAPRRAHRDLYVDEKGEVATEASRIGPLAAGVPGMVAALCHVQDRYGTLPLRDVVLPAIRLAREGFAISHHLENSLNAAAEVLDRHEESRRLFRAGGRGFAAGERLVQPELAGTLERIATLGRDGFYRGRTAELIIEEMRATGGLIDREDLDAYEVRERAPLIGQYRGYEIVTMPPPSSGGVALLQMLGILEAYPLSAYGPLSERCIHLQAEAMRIAFRDRAEFLGDPDFVPVPVARLLNREYLSRARALIQETATKSTGLAKLPLEKEETTHYSVLDAAGNAVACTTTLNTSYGSGVTVKGAGFLLNNEMDDFASAPGVPNAYELIQGEANAIAPRKRPLSSMTPTIVLANDRPYFVIGSPGGPTIINTVMLCISNVIDHGMDAAQAVNTPRFHHQWLPDELRFERLGIVRDVQIGLQRLGHRLEARGRQGDAHGILRETKTGRLQAASDPRAAGAARAF